LALWRRLVCLGDFRFCLRRSETVLWAVRKAGMEANKVYLLLLYWHDVLSTVSVHTIFFSCCSSYLINEYVMLGLVSHYVCRNGILTFRKVVIDDVRRNHPIVANFIPCFLNEDHTTVEGMQTCRECNPYTSSLSPTNWERRTRDCQ